MPGINIELEMRALDAELEGMKAENVHRRDCGLSIAFGADGFDNLAERYRALKENANVVEVVHENENLTKSIRILGLGDTTQRTLEGNGIRQISDLVKLTRKELSGIRLIGSTTLKKIERALTEMGLKLKEVKHA